MSGTIERRLASLTGRLLDLVYPRSQSGWARAMRVEIEQVEDDSAALTFALGCLWGGCRQAAAEPFASVARGARTLTNLRSRDPLPVRTLAIACALAATVAGILYLAAAGAPLRYPVVNAAAFLLGIVALRGVTEPLERFGSGALLVVLGAALLATALFGSSADGATRWVRVGPLGVQTSLVLVPFMAVAFARDRSLAGMVGIGVAAAALALQPDRAMAGILAFAMAALAIAKPERFTFAALAASLAAFAAALVRPDSLPAVPFVDRILFTAFDVHLAVGAAILLGSVLLLVPSIAGLRGDPGSRHVHLAFGAAWLGCIAAAALGNYPTPVVGYGGSAILGYLLSVAGLPRAVRSLGAPAAAGRADADRPAGLRRSVSPA